MNLFYPAIILVAWGLLALLLLILATARARALVDKPAPRSTSPSTRCQQCRLPFHKASWRCGRCGAYMKPRPLYWLGRGIVEPLLSLLIIPWFVLFGILLSISILFTSSIIPRTTHGLERLANRLGAWIAPMFARWVPQRWRFPASGTVLLPHEVDAPIETAVGAALTLATCLLTMGEEEIELRIPLPSEETLDMLRKTPGRVQEVWGYISDGHPMVPIYQDQIIEARSHGEDLLRYVEALARHLEEPLKEIEILPMVSDTGQSPESPPPWLFLLRREPEGKSIYPLRWEIHTEPEILLRIEALLNDLDAWDSLPCHLVFS